MGHWWKKIDGPLNWEDGIIIPGNPKAWPKKNNPILWRYQQRWVIIKVLTWGNYNLAFDDGEIQMAFHTTIKTRFFAARVGPKDICFVATDPSCGIPFEVKQLYQRDWNRCEVGGISPKLISLV